MPIEHRKLARLEALLSGMPGDRELRLLLEQLDPGPGGTVTWLDPRNTTITVLPASHALPIQVLLELRGRHGLGVLVTSQEGMGPSVASSPPQAEPDNGEKANGLEVLFPEAHALEPGL